MSEVWTTIIAVALASAAIKAFGPVFVGGREFSARAVAVISLLAPALLASLVVTETFSEGQNFVLDERAAGVVVAGVALLLRAHVLLAVGLAVITVALIRAVG